ncbi:hypothetical protein [Sphingopyxis sp.]|uniref:hypothetical protein n=1 Tax=Sphingopyxis sp. TaxID=1908224 RepID=UPI002602913C|nr:hypothetical protein [Sphingopyxis sp.]MCW0198865.1 hypothetical protein [Sphingopyxis sp.]
MALSRAKARSLAIFRGYPQKSVRYAILSRSAMAGLADFLKKRCADKGLMVNRGTARHYFYLAVVPYRLPPAIPALLRDQKTGSDARRRRSRTPSASPMPTRLFGASLRSIAPPSQPFSGAQFGLDLALFGGVVAP